MDTDTDTHVVNKIQQKKKYQPNWNNIWNLQMVVDVHFSHLYTDTMHTLGPLDWSVMNLPRFYKPIKDMVWHLANCSLQKKM